MGNFNTLYLDLTGANSERDLVIQSAISVNREIGKVQSFHETRIGKVANVIFTPRTPGTLGVSYTLPANVKREWLHAFGPFALTRFSLDFRHLLYLA